jgi:phage baseplate assembly protein W
VSIKITSLSPNRLAEKSLTKDYLYKDLLLDLASTVSYNSQLNQTEYLKDVAALFDIEAVKNSVVTAFLTAPGDKILSPTYGMDLRQFLFEPIDDFLIDIIEDLILNKLPKMEPRVEVTNVTVTGDPDNNTIFITLQINVPSLDVYGLSIKSELNSTGYSIA